MYVRDMVLLYEKHEQLKVVTLTHNIKKDMQYNGQKMDEPTINVNVILQIKLKIEQQEVH